jgi:hypothetical protein
MVVWGSYPDPHKSMKALGGLTPDQVIAQLGPPWNHDDRKWHPINPGGKPWTPAQEAAWGPLVFIYHDALPRWKGYRYAVIFQNNRVSQVRWARK